MYSLCIFITSFVIYIVFIELYWAPHLPNMVLRSYCEWCYLLIVGVLPSYARINPNNDPVVSQYTTNLHHSTVISSQHAHSTPTQQYPQCTARKMAVRDVGGEWWSSRVSQRDVLVSSWCCYLILHLVSNLMESRGLRQIVSGALQPPCLYRNLYEYCQKRANISGLVICWAVHELFGCSCFYLICSPLFFVCVCPGGT